MAKLFKDNKPIPMDTYSTAVSLKDIVSEEGTMTDGVFEPILKSITFNVAKGEVVGVYGKNPLESKLVVEIISNLRHYYSGKCVLIERGMMKDKRYILPQLFFFNNNSMLIENMTVLEYLSFTQNLKTKEYAKMQKNILDELCGLGMDYISLTPINFLTVQEKMLVQLLTAYLTKSNIIVADLNEITFQQKEIDIFHNITRLIVSAQISLIFATRQMDLIRKSAFSYVKIENGVCNRTLPVKDATLNEKLAAIKKELLTLLKESGADLSKNAEIGKTESDILEKVENSLNKSDGEADPKKTD